MSTSINQEVQYPESLSVNMNALLMNSLLYGISAMFRKAQLCVCHPNIPSQLYPDDCPWPSKPCHEESCTYVWTVPCGCDSSWWVVFYLSMNRRESGSKGALYLTDFRKSDEWQGVLGCTKTRRRQCLSSDRVEVSRQIVERIEHAKGTIADNHKSLSWAMRRRVALLLHLSVGLETLFLS